MKSWGGWSLLTVIMLIAVGIGAWCRPTARVRYGDEDTKSKLRPVFQAICLTAGVAVHWDPFGRYFAFPNGTNNSERAWCRPIARVGLTEGFSPDGTWWHVHAGIPGQPSRPWHQGLVHIACTRSGEPDHAYEHADQVARWESCECRHGCDPDNNETHGRTWDPVCKARCSVDHCRCPHPCSQTDNDAP